MSVEWNGLPQSVSGAAAVPRNTVASPAGAQPAAATMRGREGEGSGGEGSREEASETIQRGLRQEVVRDRDRRLRREVPLGDILPHPYLRSIPAY